MHENRHCKKKLGQKNIFFKYSLVICQTKRLGKENSDFKNFEKKFKLAELGPKTC